jgi:hypothetical protein
MLVNDVSDGREADECCLKLDWSSGCGGWLIQVIG